jgi:hypothetical protein
MLFCENVSILICGVKLATFLTHTTDLSGFVFNVYSAGHVRTNFDDSSKYGIGVHSLFTIVNPFVQDIPVSFIKVIGGAVIPELATTVVKLVSPPDILVYILLKEKLFKEILDY